MITKETAILIAQAYREIEAGEKLLSEVEKELETPDRINFYGEVESGKRTCQLGWPSGRDSYRIYHVEPHIAKAVIVAHLADQRAKLEKLNIVAGLEVSTQTE